MILTFLPQFSIFEHEIWHVDRSYIHGGVIQISRENAKNSYHKIKQADFIRG